MELLFPEKRDRVSYVKSFKCFTWQFRKEMIALEEIFDFLYLKLAVAPNRALGKWPYFA